MATRLRDTWLLLLLRRRRLVMVAASLLLLLVFLRVSHFSVTLGTNRNTDRSLQTKTSRPKSLNYVLLKKIHDLVPGPHGVQKGSCQHIRYPEQPCLDTNCTGGYPKSATTRLKKLMDARYHIPDDIRETIVSMVTEQDRAEVHLVTATSANHFREGEGVLTDLRDIVLLQLPSVRVFYYDLGLTQQQRNMLKTYCKFCTVRRIPFSKLPQKATNLRHYMWKPILMAAHLPHSRFTIWMDASLRFQKGANMTMLLERGASAGLLYDVDYHSLPVHTAVDTLAYFGVKPCWISIYHEVQSGFLVWHNEPFIREIVMELWLSCALAPNCLCPGDDCERLWGCKWRKEREYSKCHRYDQTALAMVTVSLLQGKITALIMPRGVIVFKRGDYKPFFPVSTTPASTVLHSTRRSPTNRTSTSKHATKKPDVPAKSTKA